MNRISYAKFIGKKLARVYSAGFEPEPINDKLFDFQRHCVDHACRCGRFALFADTGLGKTAMQLEWGRQASNVTRMPTLIAAPLAVSSQTHKESAKFGATSEVSKDGRASGNSEIVITNYERLALFDPSMFGAIVLDESSILKSYTGKTRNLIIGQFATTPYKLACTATPAPNDHQELGNHAEFLGICSRSEMLAEYFINDASGSGDWRLKGHAVRPFWQWVGTWASCFKSPADLGFDGASFELPPLHIVEELVECQFNPAEEGLLFAPSALSATEVRQVQNQTSGARCARAVEIATSTADQVLIWCETNADSSLLARSIRGAVEVKGAMTADSKESALLGFADGTHRVLITKPSIAGFGMNWQNCNTMIFASLSYSYEKFYQSVRRCWRYGQTRPVTAYLLATEMEMPLIESLKAKQARADTMASQIAALTKESKTA